MTREQITEAIDNNVPDNNEKAITPEMVRTALQALNDGAFVPDSDTLEDMAYDAEQTLAEKLDASSGGVLLHTSSGNINVRNQAQGSNVSGDAKSTMTIPTGGNHEEELRIRVTFTDSVSGDYTPIVTWEANATWHANNAVITAWGDKSSTGMDVYLQRIYDSPVGKIHVTLIKV